VNSNSSECLPTNNPGRATIGILSIAGFLVGCRFAILALGAHPRTWLLGMVLVLSAGFAREYDNEDLLHDPWYLLIPFAASLGASFVLFFCLYGIGAVGRKNGPPYLRAYLVFLGLFWMTAPLAWLYAIPYERFLDPVSAIHANLATLGLVSAWRVALMVRVAVVMLGMTVRAAFFRVLAYGTGVAALGMCFLPFPLIEIMGGLYHLTEAESVVRGTSQAILCFGAPAFVILFLLAMVSEHRVKWGIDSNPESGGTGVTRPLYVLLFASIAIWAAVLPFTQPEQQLRREVEGNIAVGKHAEALALMSAHDQEDFPPQWEPPPRFLKGENNALTLDMISEISRHETAPWVRSVYLDKLKRYLTQRFMDEEKVAQVLNELPEGASLVAELASVDRHRWSLERLQPHLRPELRALLKGRDE
jgi:hypothetical protein